MSALTSISAEIVFNNVISYAFKLFQEIWKQGYLSHVESTFARSLNIRMLERSFSALFEVMALSVQSSFILQTLWTFICSFPSLLVHCIPEQVVIQVSQSRMFTWD